MQKVLTRMVALMLAVSLLVGSSLAPQSVLAQTPSQSDIRITITESFIAYLLETQLDDALEDMPIPLENPRVDLKPDNKIDLTVLTVLQGLGSIEPTITIGLAVEGNRLLVTLETLTNRGVSMPMTMPLLAGQIGPVQEGLQATVDEALAGLTESAGLAISGIRTTDTLITIYMSAVQQ
jgi:hypothetical protein